MSLRDDPVLVPADELARPRTASDLLAALDVADAPRDEQQARVARWLVDNEPSRLIRAGLTRLRLLHH